MLFVSHDRYFIDGLATRVFEVEAGRVHIYPGNYEDYLWRKQGGPEKVAASLAQETKVELPPPAPVAVAPPPPPASAVKRLNPIKLRQLEERLEFAEAEIPRLESAIAAAEEKLGVFTTAEDAQRNAADLDALRNQRAALLTEWEELAVTLEEQATAQ